MTWGEGDGPPSELEGRAGLPAASVRRWEALAGELRGPGRVETASLRRVCAGAPLQPLRLKGGPL